MSALATLAGQAGIKVVAAILSKKLGDGAGQLAGDVLGEIAKKAGIPVEDLDQAAEDQPQIVIDAVRNVESRTP